MNVRSLVADVVAGRNLSVEEARIVFAALMNGELEPDVVASLLAALAGRGETVEEIVGASRALRGRVIPVALPPDTPGIDTCGTGGDGKAILNVSTAAGIVAAAAGATVAKHGNRSNLRPSGSAEVLQALGVEIEADPGVLERCLRECRIAFLYAPRLHPAMKQVAPIRRRLGGRTIFNLIGPLTNPAGVRRQLVGVNRPELIRPMLSALIELGAERAMVVHGLDGLCDLSLSGPTLVETWDGNFRRSEQVDGGVVGAARADLEALAVRSPEDSAAMLRGVVEGRPGPARDIVVFNAAAALWVAGRATNWAEGARQARQAIDSGAARGTLDRWARCSRECVTV